MQIKKIKAFMAGLVIMGLTFTACSGEDGEDGATGPQGPTGNANVSGSNYTITQADWNGIGRVARFNGDITADVVSTGTVNAFISSDTAVTFTPAPVGNFSFSYKQDSVIFSTPGFTGASFNTYWKVVVIPSSARIQGVNLNNYEEVKMVYGIKEFDVAQ